MPGNDGCGTGGRTPRQPWTGHSPSRQRDDRMTTQSTPQVSTVHGTPVTFDHVSKSFGRTPVLRDICLEVPGGRTTCVVGPSGSGKSTLLRCTNRLEEPTAGRVLLGTTEVTDCSADIDAIRARVGMVFQTFNL